MIGGSNTAALPRGRFVPAVLFLSCLLIQPRNRHANAAKPLLPLLVEGTAFTFHVE